MREDLPVAFLDSVQDLKILLAISQSFQVGVFDRGLDHRGDVSFATISGN